jgi:hypothetical protein
MEYAIIEKGQNEWTIIDENENVIEIITKDTIVPICERELERCHLDVLDIEVFIENVWYLLNKGDNIIYNQVNTDTEYYEKFCAWFDYICAESFGNGIMNYFKQRLLDFE